jgi:hypothetical protein
VGVDRSSFGQFEYSNLPPSAIATAIIFHLFQAGRQTAVMIVIIGVLARLKKFR